MTQKRRHNYNTYQQGSLWDDKATKAIQQQAVQSKLRHSLTESGAAYRLVMGANALAQWKQGILNYQLRVRDCLKQQDTHGNIRGTLGGEQGLLISVPTDVPSNLPPKTAFDPFDLPLYPAEFYRLPCQGEPNLAANDACIYFVLDQAAQLLLYIGETCRSQKRWQGIHDCKRYIQNYQALHYQHQQPTAVVMAFVWDVPQAAPLRRELEQHLIQLWRSPFNRESWQYWQTPFV